MIEPGKKVSIEYTLTLDDGSVADSNIGRQPLVYEHGQGQILPALEEAITELEVGDTKEVTLHAEEGYGAVDAAAFQNVEPDVVPEEGRKEGAVLVARDADGRENRVRVHEVHPDRVVLDFNHPLAGERLHFDVKVLAID
jgi:FKBP-type peptidyl-prolyl cis-trans isomerase 2